MVSDSERLPWLGRQLTPHSCSHLLFHSLPARPAYSTLSTTVVALMALGFKNGCLSLILVTPKN